MVSSAFVKMVLQQEFSACTFTGDSVLGTCVSVVTQHKELPRGFFLRKLLAWKGLGFSWEKVLKNMEGFESLILQQPQRFPRAVVVLWGISSNLTSVLRASVAVCARCRAGCGWCRSVRFGSVASGLWNGLSTCLKLLSRMCRSLLHLEVPSRMIVY